MNRKKKTISSFIKEIVSNSNHQLRPFKATGELNQRYIKGLQHWKLTDNFSLQKKKYNPNIYKEKKIFNKILPIYLARQGILNNNRPIPGFKPDHNYADSMDASIQGNKFLKEFMKEINFDNLYTKIVTSGDIFALVWVKTGIDWSQGDKTYKTDMTVTDKYGKENTVTKHIYEGRPFIDICSIYEVFPTTLRGDDMEDIPALVHRRPLTVQRIKERWNVNVTPEPVEMPRDPQMFNPNPLNSHDEYAYVYEYYENPSGSRPNGRFVIVVGDQVLVDRDLPYKNGPSGRRQIPFDFYNLQSVPGFIPGVTSYAQVIDAQDTYNSIRNRLLEYINHVAIGQMFVRTNSLVNQKQWTNRPGELIMLKSHAKTPEPVRKEKIGQELMTYANAIHEDMLITAGLSQLTAFGTSKSNVRTDGVADKMSESDNNKLTVALQNVSDTIVEVFKKILYLEKERQYILGEKLELAKRDDFVVKYNLENIDPQELVIVNREFLMQSDIAIEKKMAQANNLGLYNPQAGMKYRSKLEMLQVLNSNYLADTLDPLERANYGRVKREHRKLYNKDEIKADPKELHALHIEEHTLELLSADLAKLEAQDPELFKYVTESLRKHIEEHEEYTADSSVQKDYDHAKAMDVGTAPPQQGQGQF